MNAMPQISNELFNLIESKPWLALNENEKTYVLNHLSMEEYNNLHDMFLSTVALNQSEQQLTLSLSVKEHLEKTFKKQHQKNAMIPLWQAAAVFIMMFGGFAFYILKISTMEKVIVNTIHDTVYVPKIVSSEIKKTDTVIVYQYLNSNKSNRLNTLNIHEQVPVYETNNNAELPVSQIRTLSTDEIKNCLKNIKNKSMLEDTLYQKIGYASI